MNVTVFPFATWLVRWRRYCAGALDFVLSIGIRGLGAVLALALNVLLARLLGVTEYGRYMTWLSMGLVLGGLAVRGVGQVLTREMAGGANTDRSLRRVLTRWAVGRVIRSAVLLAVVYLAWVLILQSKLSFETLQWSAALAGIGVVGLFAFCSIEAGAINGFSASLRSQALLLVVQNGGTLALLGLMYWLLTGPHRVVQALWLQTGGYAIALLLGAYWLRGLARHKSENEAASRIAPTGSRALTRGWNISSRHFLLVTVAAVLVNRVDVVLVSALSGAEVAGVYAAGARLAQVALMVALAVNVVLSPRIAHAHKRGDRAEVQRLFRSGLIFTVPIAAIEVLGAVGLAPWIVGVLGISYTASAAPFAWVTVAYALWTVAAPGYALLAMTGLEKMVAALSWVVLIVNIGAMVILVPLYGAAGGGAAMAAGYGLVLPVLLGALARRKDNDGVTRLL